MLPKTQVPEAAVVQLLGAFGTMSLPLRKGVLTWLLTVFDTLDSTTRLHKLYSVFLHYIDFDSLRSPLCHILYRLTHREVLDTFHILSIQPCL